MKEIKYDIDFRCIDCWAEMVNYSTNLDEAMDVVYNTATNPTEAYVTHNCPMCGGRILPEEYVVDLTTSKAKDNTL